MSGPKVWILEAEYMVRELYGTVEPHVIARLINMWNRSIQIDERGYKAVTLLTGNSVIDRAYRIGIISESEMEDQKKREKRRRTKARKNDELIIYQTPVSAATDFVAIHITKRPDYMPPVFDVSEREASE